jgi:hypothetical protein
MLVLGLGDKNLNLTPGFNPINIGPTPIFSRVGVISHFLQEALFFLCHFVRSRCKNHVLGMNHIDFNILVK